MPNSSNGSKRNKRAPWRYVLNPLFSIFVYLALLIIWFLIHGLYRNQLLTELDFWIDFGIEIVIMLLLSIFTAPIND